jgi:hypothetical protein
MNMKLGTAKNWLLKNQAGKVNLATKKEDEDNDPLKEINKFI